MNSIFGGSFLSWACSFWGQFSNLIRFKDTNDSVVLSKVGPDRSRHDAAMGVCKCHHWAGWLPLCVRNKVGEEKDKLRCCLNNLQVSVSPERKPHLL